MAALSGTGRLADDLYLVAHHEVTGKPHLQPRAAGLGLAGGLVGELMLAGSIRLRDGLAVVGDGVPPGDEAARRVLDQVAGERDDLAARDWLLFLARTAAADVGHRLERDGYLVRVALRRRWRGGPWVPADADCAFAPLVRVKAALDSARPVPQPVLLGGLAAACGLGHQLALFLPPGALRRLDDAVRGLPADLRELIAQTQSAVDSALLAHRV